MGVCEIILSTLVIVAIAINKELHNIQYFFIANLMICDIISSFTMNFIIVLLQKNINILTKEIIFCNVQEQSFLIVLINNKYL